MRRRSPPAASTEPMEKGNGKNQRNRICVLACLSVFFWTLLLYFHFVILGSNNDAYEHVKLQPSYAQTDPSFSLRVPKISPAPLHDTSSSEPTPVRDTNSSEPSPVNDTSSSKPPPVPDTTSSKPPPVNDTSSSKPPPVQDSSSSNPPHVSLPKFPPAPLSDAHLTKNHTPTLTNITKPVQELPKVSETNVSRKDEFPFTKALRTGENKSDPCGGRYIYVHDLPSRFNEDMLKECRSLSLWTNMCKFTTNAGLGPPLENLEGVFSDTGWYATNQFAVDVIFNNRMKQYECLTNDSSLAAAIFVPFYAGFDIARYLWGYNISRRDAASLDLVDWLMKRPEWGIMSGKDHFLVAGRITWDFRRLSEEESDWGNKLLFLPAAKNMSMLVVESSPWNANDFGIPYPTYFHPAKDSDVFNWQERMRNLDRKWLFSFAGAPRPDNPKSIRGQLIDQCRQSKVGKLLECDFGESKCHSPSSIMQMFQSSLFCLQPQGDSYTRRSAFDSMLAGCIPVFFHPGSAYTQYTWHLPKNYSTYSVFIPEDDIRKRNMTIEEILTRIPPQQVKIMRENVINLIPGLIYADPRSKLETLKDAFDVAVQAVIDKVTRLRKNMIEGRTEYDNFVEENSWKYALLDEGKREVGGHVWDPFFSKPKKEGENDNGATSSSSLSSEAAKNSWKSEQRDKS